MRSASDLKGLKVCIPRLGVDVLSKLGSSPVSMPSCQIYENHVPAGIDANKWVGPWIYSYEVLRIRQVQLLPVNHEPAAQLSLSMNKKW